MKQIRPIQDEETNFVYISDKLKEFFPEFHDNLIEKFSEMDIKFGVLRGTKDIWCRDYMPIPMNDGSFVGYKFDPDYLKESFGKPEYTEYDPKYSPIGAQFRPWERVSSMTEIKESQKIGIPSKIKNNDIILDGGNLVFCGDYVLLTNKVLDENKNMSKTEIEDKLHSMFGLTPVFINWKQEGDDFYGHTDGMIRTLPSKAEEKPSLLFLYRTKKIASELRQSLKDNSVDDKIELKPIDFGKGGKGIEKWAWAYINFLQVGEEIIMPSFSSLKLPYEESVISQFKNYFGDNLKTIDMHDIACQGGALHCLTWNIRVDKEQ